MIIDLTSFLAQEKGAWHELEALLERLENNPARRLGLEELRRFHYLYQRASADLARLTTFAAERELQRYLESLVARAYAQVHQAPPAVSRPHPLHWLGTTFPQTFRRHLGAFWLALALTVVGAVFGGAALRHDEEAKQILMPFSHLQLDPADRVAREEAAGKAVNQGQQASMSGFYFSHNTRVSILTFALGAGYGVGTVAMLFYNGVILGAVFTDYVAAGQARFVFGWLLPHGSIEIPAILLAGQAGLALAGALIGWGRRATLRQRLAAVGPDLVTLIGGVALMLLWAGLIEAFLSQYHEPVLPYWAKIAFGAVQLTLLTAYLARAGREKEGAPAAHAQA